METEKKSPVSDVGAWGMNVVSSVGIIMANKQLMSSSGYAFNFATTLTGFHFAVTALVGFISNSTGYSTAKHVPLWELVWFSLVANTSITGMNLSLMLNSVGFYQISKLSMIPVVCVMEWIIHSKHYSREVKIAVIVVVVGVGVCTVTDVKVNAKGFICAAVAVLSTSFQQIVWRRHGRNCSYSGCTLMKCCSGLWSFYYMTFIHPLMRGFGSDPMWRCDGMCDGFIVLLDAILVLVCGM